LASVSFFSVLVHKKPQISRGYWVPIALYLLMVVSCLWSYDVSKSLRGLERQLPFLILPLSFIFMPTLTRDSFKKILYLFAYFLSVLALYFFVNSAFLYFDGHSLGVFKYHYLVLPLELNAIYISVMVSISLLFILFYGKRNFRDITVGIILSVFLFLLSSKNVTLVTLMVFTIGAPIVLKFSFIKKLTVWLGAIAVATFLVLGPFSHRWQDELNTDISEVFQKNEFGQVYLWTGTTLRLFQLRIFYEMIEEDSKFLTGYGVNAAQSTIIEKQQPYNVYCGFNEYNLHNQYAQTFVELGVFGFLLIMVLLGYFLHHFLKTKELMGLTIFFIMAAIFITETYIWRQRGLIHFLILFLLLFKCFPMNSTKNIRE